MRTLLFDIDGTLLLTNQGGSSALKQALQEEFGVANASTDVSFGGRTDRSLLAQLLNINGLPETAETLRRLQQRYTSIFPSVLQQRGGEVLPGVQDLLGRLQAEPNIRMCVMTGNLPETGEHKLRHFGLLGYIEWIIGGDLDADRDDLARRAARTIEDRHGDDALDDVIVIGDTTADVRCGHTIGAQVVAVCTGSHHREDLELEQPLAVLNDLTDDQAFDLLVT